MEIKNFIDFCLRMRALTSLRSAKQRKSCLCCGFDGRPQLQSQISLLLQEVGGEKEAPISTKSLDMIMVTAKEVFPEVEETKIRNLVEALIFD